MKTFITDHFLLQTETARELYHGYASSEPILDYHCHLPPAEVAANKQFPNLYAIWLAGDHYKWRAMRANGVEERRSIALAKLPITTSFWRGHGLSLVR